MNEYMSFGDALKQVTDYCNAKIARVGWNGNNMNIQALTLYDPMATSFMHRCLGIQLPDGSMQPGWVPSQQDLFATDWYVV